MIRPSESPVLGSRVDGRSRRHRRVGHLSTSDTILAAAAHVFRTKGYQAATTEEIANLSGIRKASLYHHIKAKEDLLYALCTDSLARITAAAEQVSAQGAEPVTRLRELVRLHVVTMLADQDKHAVMLTELRSLHGARRKQVIALRDRYEGIIRQTLAECQTDGTIRDDDTVKALSLALLNLLNWTIFWYKPRNEMSAAMVADFLARIFLFGAAGPKLHQV
jgi:AcrR family transcriptional regulator